MSKRFAKPVASCILAIPCYMPIVVALEVLGNCTAAFVQLIAM